MGMGRWRRGERRGRRAKAAEGGVVVAAGVVGAVGAGGVRGAANHGGRSGGRVAVGGAAEAGRKGAWQRLPLPSLNI